MEAPRVRLWGRMMTPVAAAGLDSWAASGVGAALAVLAGAAGLAAVAVKGSLEGLGGWVAKEAGETYMMRTSHIVMEVE